MSRKQQPMKAGTPITRKQLALLVAAGLGSFLLAVVLNGASKSEDDDLAVVRPRDQRANIARVSPEASSAQPTGGTAQPGESMPDSTSRMNKVVVRDPFGLLAPEQAPPPPVPSPPPVSANAGKSRKVAPVVAQAPLPPPAPVAPPLPFTALGFIHGKKIGDGQQQTFIQQGDSLTVIRQGDTINNIYRVEDINAERVVLTYLPLGQKQSLPLLDKPK